MTDLLTDLGNYLLSNSIGTKMGIGGDIYLDYRPDSPDSIICLSEYPGEPVMPGLDAFGRRIQVLVRDLDDKTCIDKIWSIFKLLGDPNNRIIDLPTRYIITQALQPPFRLNIDIKNRTIFVFNLSITTSSE